MDSSRAAPPIAALLAAALGLSGCGAAALPGALAGAPAPALRGATEPLLSAYWESWDDTNPAAQFGPLASVPETVSIAEIADFEIHNGRAAFQGPYNARPLGSGAAALHARGAKVFLSIGGYSSQWGVKDAGAFLRAVGAVLDANPGVFDGLDFDDENIPFQDATPQAGQREIAGLILAAHHRWPALSISYTAFAMGADEPVRWKDDRGEDVAVLRRIGAIVTFVNVMEYTQQLAGGGIWHPSSHPACRWSPGAADDCYLDTLAEFAALRGPNGMPLGPAKIVMGLEIHPEQRRPPTLTPSQMQRYGAWIRAHGYAGIALWSIDRDRPGVSGYARGAFAAAAAHGLGR